jgi:hypothetical protein
MAFHLLQLLPGGVDDIFHTLTIIDLVLILLVPSISFIFL